MPSQRTTAISRWNTPINHAPPKPGRDVFYRVGAACQVSFGNRGGEKVGPGVKAYLRVRDELIALMLEGDPKQAVERDLSQGVPAFNAARDNLQAVEQLFRADADRLLRDMDVTFRRSLVRLIVIWLWRWPSRRGRQGDPKEQSGTRAHRFGRAVAAIPAEIRDAGQFHRRRRVGSRPAEFFSSHSVSQQGAPIIGFLRSRSG